MNRERLLKVVYMLQVVAAISMLLGLCLSWWHSGSHHYNALNLFGRSLDLLEQRSFRLMAQPLIVLWLLWPAIIAGVLRGATGIVVPLVSFWRHMVACWIIALLVLIHFHLSFGAEQREIESPLANGSIDIGYWLTASSTALLGLLVIIEGMLTPHHDQWMPQEKPQPVTDDQLWSGEYKSCPYCGMLNDPKSRACYNCHNLLFNFKEKIE
jgi:hypothetical protein